ncbi:MAG: hypothetical protein KDB23_17450 [Planctomycetales bacterium]|nr:hypothetical protein [Planctomycetales bacterium]
MSDGTPVLRYQRGVTRHDAARQAFDSYALAPAFCEAYRRFAEREASVVEIEPHGGKWDADLKIDGVDVRCDFVSYRMSLPDEGITPDPTPDVDDKGAGENDRRPGERQLRIQIAQSLFESGLAMAVNIEWKRQLFARRDERRVKRSKRNAQLVGPKFNRPFIAKFCEEVVDLAQRLHPTPGQRVHFVDDARDNGKSNIWRYCYSLDLERVDGESIVTSNLDTVLYEVDFKHLTQVYDDKLRKLPKNYRNSGSSEPFRPVWLVLHVNNEDSATRLVPDHERLVVEFIEAGTPTDTADDRFDAVWLLVRRWQDSWDVRRIV